MFKGKTILITGGTGSFGRWILKDILKNPVEEIRIFSRDEEKQLDVKRETNDSRIKFFIGDVRDYDRIAQACRGIDIVYHAVAQKIIDSSEANPNARPRSTYFCITIIMASFIVFLSLIPSSFCTVNSLAFLS
jgi:UDP-glucose 4-epimerase